MADPGHLYSKVDIMLVRNFTDPKQEFSLVQNYTIKAVNELSTILISLFSLNEYFQPILTTLGFLYRSISTQGYQKHFF